jgi:Cu-Zn family superoxide dismutase
MKRILGMVFLFSSASAMQSCMSAKSDSATPKRKSVVTLQSKSNSSVKGDLTLEEQGNGVLVTGTLQGLTSKGVHGFHIHEMGDCSDPEAKNAGGHFNPENHAHGAMHDAKRHLGDLGNIDANENGQATVRIEVPKATLGRGEFSVEGRALVIHAQKDDLKSQPAGNAGARIACGVIKL